MTVFSQGMKGRGTGIRVAWTVPSRAQEALPSIGIDHSGIHDSRRFITAEILLSNTRPLTARSCRNGSENDTAAFPGVLPRPTSNFFMGAQFAARGSGRHGGGRLDTGGRRHARTGSSVRRGCKRRWIATESAGAARGLTTAGYMAGLNGATHATVLSRQHWTLGGPVMSHRSGFDPGCWAAVRRTHAVR